MKPNAQDVRWFSEQAVSHREPSRSPPGRDSTLDSSVRLKTSDKDPTDPEVPTAKRLSRATTRRTHLLVTGVAIALFLLGMVLLFETGRRVTRSAPASPAAHP
jgi:hypothetical protein